MSFVFQTNRNTKITFILCLCLCVNFSKQIKNPPKKISLICVCCNHATHFHICVFIFFHPLFFLLLSFLSFSSTCHLHVTFFFSSFLPLLTSFLSFFFLFIFFHPLFIFLSLFSFHPIPHSCSNQSHRRFSGVFCDFSDCDLLCVYCIYCIPIFNIKFVSGL